MPAQSSGFISSASCSHATAHAGTDDVDVAEDANPASRDSITSCRNCAKSRQPVVPASTTVVTPDASVLTSGCSERSDRVWVCATWACMSMMPGVTMNPARSIRAVARLLGKIRVDRDDPVAIDTDVHHACRGRSPGRSPGIAQYEISGCIADRHCFLQQSSVDELAAIIPEGGHGWQSGSSVAGGGDHVRAIGQDRWIS